jgi:hypothetical protein
MSGDGDRDQSSLPTEVVDPPKPIDPPRPEGPLVPVRPPTQPTGPNPSRCQRRKPEEEDDPIYRLVSREALMVVKFSLWMLLAASAGIGFEYLAFVVESLRVLPTAAAILVPLADFIFYGDATLIAFAFSVSFLLVVDHLLLQLGIDVLYLGCLGWERLGSPLFRWIGRKTGWW